MMDHFRTGFQKENQDYDPMFWNKNEIVKRTPLEEEAIGLFDRDNLFGIF